MSIFVKPEPFFHSSVKLQGLPLEAVKHDLMKDGEDPSIVDPDYGKLAREQETTSTTQIRSNRQIKQADSPKKENMLVPHK